MLSNCGAGEDFWDSLGLQGDQISQSSRKSVLNIHRNNWYWGWSSNTLATWYEGWLIGKDPDAVEDWRQEEKGMTEDEMAGWHHWLDRHEFESTLEVGDGQGGPECCSPWGCKELDTTESLNNSSEERGWEQMQEGSLAGGGAAQDPLQLPRGTAVFQLAL